MQSRIRQMQSTESGRKEKSRTTNRCKAHSDRQTKAEWNQTKGRAKSDETRQMLNQAISDAEPGEIRQTHNQTDPGT